MGMRDIVEDSLQLDDVSVIMILKMYFCGIKTHIQQPICLLTFQKDKRRYQNTLQHEAVFLTNLIDCGHLIFHQILFVLQILAITPKLTAKMDSPDLKPLKTLYYT